MSVFSLTNQRSPCLLEPGSTQNDSTNEWCDPLTNKQFEAQFPYLPNGIIIDFLDPQARENYTLTSKTNYSQIEESYSRELDNLKRDLPLLNLPSNDCDRIKEIMRSDKSKINVFKKIISYLKTNVFTIFPRSTPCTSPEIIKLKQIAEDEAIIAIWREQLAPRCPVAGSIAPAANSLNAIAIRRWITDPANASFIARFSYLNLTATYLRILPPEIRLFTGLTDLYLKWNDLCSLPKEMSKLTQLRNIYLENNRLSKFPEILTQIQGLQRIGLNSNQLKIPPRQHRVFWEWWKRNPQCLVDRDDITITDRFLLKLKPAWINAFSVAIIEAAATATQIAAVKAIITPNRLITKLRSQALFLAFCFSEVMPWVGVVVLNKLRFYSTTDRSNIKIGVSLGALVPMMYMLNNLPLRRSIVSRCLATAVLAGGLTWLRK